MFPRRTEPELEARTLRSGRIFRSGKRRKTEKGRQNPSLFEESEHELQSQVDKRYYDEEEDYSSISEGPEDPYSSDETLGSDYNYLTPAISLETRSRVSSPERTPNMDSTSPRTSAKGGTPHLNTGLEDLDANSMPTTDVWLPTFNGNGTEDLKQH